MPVYEFVCKQCGTEFEQRQPMAQAEQLPACPECASKQTKKRLSNFVTVSKLSSSAITPCGSDSSECACGGACER